jgi:hypothetical protein
MWPAPKSGLSFDLPLVGHILHFRVPWTGDDWDGGNCANVTDEELKRNEREQHELNGVGGGGSNQQCVDSLEDSRDYNRHDGGGSSPVQRSSLTDVFRAKVSFFLQTLFFSFSLFSLFFFFFFWISTLTFRPLIIDNMSFVLQFHRLFECASGPGAAWSLPRRGPVLVLWSCSCSFSVALVGACSVW